MSRALLRRIASAAICLGMGLYVASQANAATPVKIMALGDSITYGETNNVNTQDGQAPGPFGTNVPVILGGYRKTFVSNLTNAGYSFQMVGSVTNNSTTALTAAGQNRHEGHGGYTIGKFYGDWSIIEHIDSWMSSSKPDAVLLMAGTNDILWSRESSAISPDTAITAMTTVLNKIWTANASTKIFLSSIVPLQGDYAYLNTKVINYNTKLKTLANTLKSQGKAITFVDNYASFTANGVSASSAYLSEGIHPNAAGYQLIANNFSNAVLAPEPGTIGLISAVGGALFLRRRKAA